MISKIQWFYEVFLTRVFLQFVIYYNSVEYNHVFTKLKCYLQINKIYVYRIIMKKRVWFANHLFSGPLLYLLSRVSVTALNYSSWVAYYTDFVFIMRIWVNDKTTKKWGSEDACLDENMWFSATTIATLFEASVLKEVRILYPLSLQ